MKKFYCLLAAAVLSLNACSFADISRIPSYKLEIVQGNDLDAQAIRQLQAGMSREQVQMLLGTPLLQDPFHANRWDYIFVVNRDGMTQENKSLTLYFNDQDQLIRTEGDALNEAGKVVAQPLWQVNP
ncbi:outer membrane protein assembly factor BamE [Neisseriaceae bacterium ESL0693]|nr:outer membrane protein assembly factor BamE [Neisseriaceae bacterium ESL0693]